MSASERKADITGYMAPFGFMSTRLDRVDIRALQHRLRIAIARHLDHGAASCSLVVMWFGVARTIQDSSGAVTA